MYLHLIAETGYKIGEMAKAIFFEFYSLLTLCNFPFFRAVNNLNITFATKNDLVLTLSKS